VTRRDASEFMELAAAIPIRTTTDLYPLEAANDALVALKEGRVRGAAVLTMS
jgi:propanol-preferring alcohol dehydrogenase